jgi:hypothetical protein
MSESSADKEAAARNRICDFLRAEGESRPREEVLGLLEGPVAKVHPNLGPLLVFTGALGEFWVSADGGHVITYSAPRRFTPTEAQEYAAAFLRRNIEDFEKRNYEQVHAEMDDPFWKEEWIERPRHPDEVSIFQNWALIQVNLDARKAHYFNASNLRLSRTAEPAMDEAAARKRILERFPEGIILELELLEHTTDGGVTTITIWQATVNPDGDPDTPRKLLSIDADTGEIVP